jgi:hypothetical protein
MSKITAQLYKYRTAFFCNLLLYITPIIALMFWHIGAYEGKENFGAAPAFIIGGLFTIPSLVVSIILLRKARASRNLKINIAAKNSAIFGLASGIYLSSWLLIMEPTW